jgi:hypothetical protein
VADTAPSTAATRTRRTILTGAAAATVAGILAGKHADAAPGQPVLQGRDNNAGATRTSLLSSAASSALRVVNSNGVGVATSTANRNSFGLSASNTGATNGTGAAISASSTRNHGVIASTAAGVRQGLLARNTSAITNNLGSAIRGQGGVNDGVVGLSGAADRGGLVGIDTTFDTTNVGWGVLCEGDEYVFGTSFVDGDVDVLGDVVGGGDIDLAGNLFGGGDADFIGNVTAANFPGGATVTLDGAGTAVVGRDEAAPAGTEYNYQLTAIGSAMPNLHVVEGSDGSFTVAGGSPGGRVSWQRTSRNAARPRRAQSQSAKARRSVTRRFE